MRKKVIAGNWKMNMLPNETIEYIENFSKLVKDTKNEVILCVCINECTGYKYKNWCTKYAL